MDLARHSMYWLRAAGIFTVLLVWYVIEPRGPGLFGWSPTVVAHAGMAAFVATFVFSDLARLDGRQIIVIQAIAALAVVAVCRGSSAPILIIIVVAQLAFEFPPRRAAAMALGLNAILLATMMAAWDAPFINALLSVLLFGTFQLFALLLASYARSVDQAREQLREVNAELLATRSLLVESARDRERLRLSRELHDTAGHSLTALKLNLRQLVQSTTGENQYAARQSLQLADGLLEDIRALVGNLRQTDGLEIAGAIRELTAPFDRPRFELRAPGNPCVQDLDSARAFISVAREAITNVVRHADADHCLITLDDSEGRIRMQVEDDGCGIGRSSHGNGLTGMAERLRSLSGDLKISDRDQGGTRLVATMVDRVAP